MGSDQGLPEGLIRFTYTSFGMINELEKLEKFTSKLVIFRLVVVTSGD